MNIQDKDEILDKALKCIEDKNERIEKLTQIAKESLLISSDLCVKLGQYAQADKFENLAEML